MLAYKDLLFTGPEAVCVLDVGLNIRQHNQLAELLLGYRDKKLAGAHISDILFDDTLTRHLSVLNGNSGWYQGECALKTSSNLPLAVKYRAVSLMDEALFPTHQKAIDSGYQPSESQSPEAKNGYVLVFSETSEAQELDYKRKIKSLRFLLDAISKRDESPEDILLGFARIFDQHADAILLPPDFAADKSEEKERRFLLTPSATAAALQAKSERATILHRDDNLWCFFPIYSGNKVHGVACIRFAVPRFYSEEDKSIFSLAGRALSIYMSSFTADGQRPSSQSLFQTIIDGIDQPVVVADRNGVITLCNAAVKSTYGYTISEMTGKLFGDFILQEGSSVHYDDILNKVIQGGSIHDEEMTHLCKGWATMDVSVTAYPYKLDDGLIVGAVFILRDLREKKRLWNKIMEWEKLAALGQLLTRVANELNNPLTALTGYSQLLLHRRSDAEIDNMVSIIHKEAERCGNIVRGVLALARGNGEWEEYLHVNDIITAVLNLKRRQLKPENIDVSVKLGQDIPGIVADPYDIERLFLRIINYAEQRMMEYDHGGQLAVESAFEDGNIIVRFTDTGTCILKNDIFETLNPFFTQSEQDEEIELGLCISCQILRNIGGNIRVDSEMGKGNTFTVQLPVLKGVSADLVDQPEETVAHTPESGKRILVVDDEPTIVELIVEVLRQMGHITDTAGDGNEAMNKLRIEDYDLIITDLRMPSGFTGDRLHKFIERKDPDLAQRMIFITGDAANPESREFLQSTGNPYLEKPFLLESLEEAIQKSLSK